MTTSRDTQIRKFLASQPAGKKFRASDLGQAIGVSGKSAGSYLRCRADVKKTCINVRGVGWTNYWEVVPA